jgi:hypothetical protein
MTKYQPIYPRKARKEIGVTVDGLTCAIGYIDKNDLVVFYDQYL